MILIIQNKNTYLSFRQDDTKAREVEITFLQVHIYFLILTRMKQTFSKIKTWKFFNVIAQFLFSFQL